jgi:hypothetical protein
MTDVEITKYYSKHNLDKKIAKGEYKDDDPLITVWNRMENLLGCNISMRQAEVWLHILYGDDAFKDVY